MTHFIIFNFKSPISLDIHILPMAVQNDRMLLESYLAIRIKSFFFKKIFILGIAPKEIIINSEGEKKNFTHYNVLHSSIYNMNNWRWSKYPWKEEWLSKMWYIHLMKYLRAYIRVAGGSDSKASTSNVRDPGLIPGLGRSPGEGNGNPLQYSCLENSMDGGAC